MIRLSLVRLSLVGLLLSAVGGHARAVELDATRPISRIAVGSCARQDRPQPIWEAVAAFRPDVLLMLGDNIYGDTEDMAVMRAKYAELAAQPGFAALRERVPIVAVWDDHDYGANDTGREYPRKRESQQEFLDFFGVAADSPLRTQAGIYRAVTVGPPGRRVQFVCLDTRYHRSPLTKAREGGGSYAPTTDPDATVLGAEQWAWLEGVLREPAEVRIVLSSIQVAATEHHHEHWGNFPAERARLLRTIRASGARGVVVVSGDRHAGEISRIPAGPEALAYPLYDLTASSLNQPKGGGGPDEPNRLRLGPWCRGVNFGTIEIDWDAAEPALTLAVRDERGDVFHAERATLGSLAPP
ncbi:MAG: alkaline phosphatase D family protein [Planctomycetaceae bacterium]